VAPGYRHLGFSYLVGEDGMSQNALLRSVKGLGIPGTARKEDKKAKLKVASPAPQDDSQSFQDFGFQNSDSQNPADPKDHFAVRNGVRCAGVHLIIDLHGAKRLNDIEHIETTLRHCVEAANATLLHIHLHRFQPSGVSGVAVLAESHISIHTWPETGYAALDVFMCGSADPDKCIPVLREAFSAQSVGVNELLRGQKA
jgi:S-adenosylmethionine decarboxylase